MGEGEVDVVVAEEEGGGGVGGKWCGEGKGEVFGVEEEEDA